MSLPKTILTDADGCLVNWNSTFEIFMHEKGHPRVTRTIDNYAVGHRHGLPHGEGLLLAQEFNSSKFIESLHPYADAQKYVAKLHQEGFSFIVLTSFGSDERAKEMRRKNLRDLFGNAVQEIIYLPFGDTKEHALSRWKDSDLFWIEDHIHNALVGARQGLNAILVDQPYNQNTFDTEELLFARTSYERPWKDIYNLVHSRY